MGVVVLLFIFTYLPYYKFFEWASPQTMQFVLWGTWTEKEETELHGLVQEGMADGDKEVSRLQKEFALESKDNQKSHHAAF